MGTWISHLRVAAKLLQRWPDLDPAGFAIGNLAPDSGLPNADWTAYDPPKTVTHWLREGHGEGRIRDLVFYRQYLAPADAPRTSERGSFLLGYYVHLLCDNLWATRINSSYRAAYQTASIASDVTLLAKIKRDWYDLDHLYLREHPNSLFWTTLLLAPNPPSYVAEIPELGLHQNLDHIRRFYSEPAERDLDRRFPFLRPALMDRFVSDAADAVVLALEQLADGAPSEGEHVLALLPPELYAPYPAPLGEEAPLE